MEVLEKILMIAGAIVLLPTALFIVLALSVFVLQKCLTQAEVWKIFFDYNKNKNEFKEWRKLKKQERH
jgi:hypothetical protein